MHLSRISLLSFISLAVCETVHFTNSPTHLVRSKNFTSYKLDVPGSGSITIIEANAGNPSYLISDLPKKNYEQSNVPEHIDPTIEDDVPVKRMVYAPALLNKFIKEYNSKVGTILTDKNGDQYLLDKSNIARVDYINRPPNNNNNHSEYSAVKQNVNPYEKEEWVTLQAPWAKQPLNWKTNKNRNPSNNENNLQSYDKIPNDSDIYWNKNQDEAKPLTNLIHKRPSFYDQGSEDDYIENNNNKPIRPESPDSLMFNYGSKPGTYQMIKPYQDNEMENSQKQNDRWYDYGFRPNFEDNKKPYNEDLLVGDQSNIFRVPVKKTPSYYIDTQYQNMKPSFDQMPPHEQQQQQQPQQQQHQQSGYSPASSGSNEWILVSTTKAYQYPRWVHRGTSLSSNYTLNRKNKSVKLTVISPTDEQDTDILSTSQGSSTSEMETVPQTVNNNKPSLPKRKKTKTKSKRKVNSNRKFVQAIPVIDHKPDKSAVLAAVGAGMVPATVAMLMPMVLGRRKRDTSILDMNTDRQHRPIPPC